jgi:hypothetical protein
VLDASGEVDLPLAEVLRVETRRGAREECEGRRGGAKARGGAGEQVGWVLVI